MCGFSLSVRFQGSLDRGNQFFRIRRDPWFKAIKQGPVLTDQELAEVPLDLSGKGRVLTGE